MFTALDGDRDELIDIDELRDDMTTVLEGEIRTVKLRNSLNFCNLRRLL
jgi:hypothetical protein